MAVTGVFWNGGQNDDIHVLRGQTSRHLDNLLVITQSPGSPFFANNAAAKAAAGVTKVEFVPIFAFSLAAHGVKVDTATGEVTAGPAPVGVPIPHNFIVRARVTAGAQTFETLIRVHVHESVTAVRLTPSTLTARFDPAVGANPVTTVSFSIVAEFNDGVFAHLSRHGDTSVANRFTTWTSSAPADASVDATTGVITALKNTGVATITATLPADLGGAAAPGTVQLADGWASRRTASLVPGSSSAPDAPQLLFLPDGFQAGEEDAFRRLVAGLWDKWRRSALLSPFDRLPLRLYTAWVPSRERGVTVHNALAYANRTPANPTALPLPFPVEPPLGANVRDRIKKVEQLLFQVGLPIPAESDPTGANHAAKLGQWQALYGLAHVGDVPLDVYSKWANLADYTIALERDTAFGTVTGKLPQVARYDDGRAPGVHFGRAHRTEIDKLLGALEDAAGTPIGATWLAGRSSSLVFVLTAGGREAGATLPAERVVVVSSNEPTEVGLNPVAGRHIPELRPYALTNALSMDSRATITHEACHVFFLGDEYGEAHTADASRLERIRTEERNLQAEADVMGAAGIDGARINWKQWPRIRTAGVLTAPPAGGPASFTIQLRAGHAQKLSIGDRVRLRKRPFLGLSGAPQRLTYLPESDELEVTLLRSTAAGDEVVVQLSPGGLLIPAAWPANSILFAKQGASMLHPTVEAFITTTHLPLNRSVALCADDYGKIQIVAARRATLGIKKRKPRYKSWIVGLYDGGSSVHCGVFHSTGACLMRSLRVPNSSLVNPGIAYRLCPICRYLLVDHIDPSLHDAMDDAYELLYPEAL